MEFRRRAVDCELVRLGRGDLAGAELTGERLAVEGHVAADRIIGLRRVDEGVDQHGRGQRGRVERQSVTLGQVDHVERPDSAESDDLRCELR